LKPSGGVAHFYTFVDASASLKSTQLSFRKATEECGRKVKRILSSKLVRATAPYEWQAVLDVKIH
jgi:tRNA G37 N-methylase Trm5